MPASTLIAASRRLVPAIAALILAVFGWSLSAAPARAEFMGGGAIYAANNCAWPQRVEMTRARYRPSEDGESHSVLTLDFAVGGTNVYAVRGPLQPRNLWRPAQGTAVWGALYRMSPGPQMRVFERVDVLGTGTDIESLDSIRFLARIRHFNGQRGCTVSVMLTMQRWE